VQLLCSQWRCPSLATWIVRLLLSATVQYAAVADPFEACIGHLRPRLEQGGCNYELVMEGK